MTKSKTRYVMRGNPRTKELDIYHLILAVSYDCNLHCQHCYNEDGRNKADQLSLEKGKSIVDEWAEIVREEGKEYKAIIHFKGGEPFVYPGINELLSHAAHKEVLKIFITSNGTTVNETHFTLLKKVQKKTKGNLKLILSLNGSKPEIDALLRGANAFSKTIALAKRLQKQGIAFDINYVIHSKNQLDLKSAVQLAEQLGAEQFNILPLVLRGNALKNGIKKANQERLLKDLEEIYFSGNERIKSLLEGSIIDLISKTRQGKCACASCTAGYKGLLYVLPNGEIYSCPNTVLPQLKAGNIKEISLNQAMQSPVFRSLASENNTALFKGICKGEKMLYRNNPKAFTELEDKSKQIQSLLCPQKKSLFQQKRVASCLNRNW